MDPQIPEWLKRQLPAIRLLEPAREPTALTAAEIQAALARPIWPDGASRTLGDIVKPGESVCIVVSDQTRKTAADRVLPHLLREFANRGVAWHDVGFLVASGIHRPPTEPELAALLGPALYDQFQDRVFLHDPDDETNLETVGTTTRGHQVRINRRAVQADRLVLLGAATYHYHAGFGGGRKSLVPGLASRDTIAYNHSLTLDPRKDRIRPGVGPGMLDGNPVAEEMLEGARLCRPDVTIVTVLTPSGHLVGCFTGDLDAAHRRACAVVEDVCRVDIDEPVDLVIAIAAGAPNWIQSHKALYNASRALRAGGRIVIHAPCPEGLGDERFRYWLRQPSLAALYRALRQAPEVLGQTALSTKERGMSTILVTDLSASDLADLGLDHAPDLETAVLRALAHLAAKGTTQPTACFMPAARYTVPFISRSKRPDEQR